MKYTLRPIRMRPKTLRSLWVAVDAVPVIIPAALAAFSAVALLFLLLGQFRNGYVWPFGLLAAAAASWTVWKHYPRNVAEDKARRACNILLILGVLVWGSFNAFYTTSHVMINRDPAIYANGGIWLAKHDNLKIPASHVFGSSEKLHSDSIAFKYSYDGSQKHVYAQGQHLLPAMIGLAGRVAGIPRSLHVNVLFGMTAILALYAFARALARRTWWALVATAVFAASMPLIYFSRDTYSEPLAATFTFGALALLWLAIRAKRPGLWFLAGLLAGAGMMTRIDGMLTVAELLAFVAIMLAVAEKRKRAERARQSAAFIFGMVVTAVIGWLDVSRLSPAYYSDLHRQFHRESTLVFLVAIIGLIGVYLAWRTRYLHKAERMTRPWRPKAAVLLTLLAAILLISRPLWHISFNPKTGNRSYAELSTQWISWYVGQAMAILGLAGILLATREALERPRLLLTAGLLVVIGTSTVYLVMPSIAPDQIWASRRLLPVILPGLLVFGVVALEWLSDQYLDGDRYKYAGAVLIGVALVLPALITSKSLVRSRLYVELPAMNSVCRALPKDAAVLWVGTARLTMVQPTKGLCGVPAEGYGHQSLRFITTAQEKVSGGQELAQIEASAFSNGRRAIVGVLSSEQRLLPASARNNLKPVANFQFNKLENTLTGPPKQILTTDTVVLMGRIQPDGQVTPL